MDSRPHSLLQDGNGLLNYEFYSKSGRQLPHAVLDTFYLILGWFRQLKCAFFELSLQQGAQGSEEVPEGSALIAKKCNRIKHG
jgi:hypothetical protein